MARAWLCKVRVLLEAICVEAHILKLNSVMPGIFFRFETD